MTLRPLIVAALLVSACTPAAFTPAAFTPVQPTIAVPVTAASVAPAPLASPNGVLVIEAKSLIMSNIPAGIDANKSYDIGLPVWGEKRLGDVSIRLMAPATWRISVVENVNVDITPVDVNGESPGNAKPTLRSKPAEAGSATVIEVDLNTGWYFVQLSETTSPRVRLSTKSL